MRTRRSLAPLLASLALAALAAACQVLVGIGSRDEAAVEKPPTADGSIREDAGADAADAAESSLACKIGQSVCAGACVDVRTDDRHCGACGHSCLGVACNAGECTPEVVVPDTVEGAVYVHGDELLFRRGVDGSSTGRLVARHLATGDERTVVGDVRDFMVMSQFSGSSWLLVDFAPARIRLVDVVFGSSTTVYSDPTCPAIRSVVPDGDELFFPTRGDIRRIRVDGTGLTVLKTITEGPAGAVPALVVSGGTIYHGVEDVPSLFAFPRGGGATTTVDRGTGELAYVEVAAGSVAWLSGGQLRDVPYDGGAPSALPTFTVFPQPSPQRRDDYLYVGDVEFGKKHNRLVRIDRRSGEVLVLESELADFGLIAVDAKYVYVARFPKAGGGIYRVAR